MKRYNNSLKCLLFIEILKNTNRNESRSGTVQCLLGQGFSVLLRFCGSSNAARLPFEAK